MCVGVRRRERQPANGKKAGAAFLDTYEKAVVSSAESYEKAAGTTKVGLDRDRAAAA